MCPKSLFKAPSIPAPPPPPPPAETKKVTPAKQSVQTAGEQSSNRIRAMRGDRSTVMTGSQRGVLSSMENYGKNLLGD